jgi:hypothetical protein
MGRASVIVASGSARDARLSQLTAAPAGAALPDRVATETANIADIADITDITDITDRATLAKNPVTRKYFVDTLDLIIVRRLPPIL